MKALFRVHKPFKLAVHFDQLIFKSRKVSADPIEAKADEHDQNPELPILHLNSSLDRFPRFDHSAWFMANLSHKFSANRGNWLSEAAI